MRVTTLPPRWRNALHGLVLLGIVALNMSRERDMMGLLKRILWSARQLTNCDAATLYIVTEQRTLRFAIRTRDDNLPASEIPLIDEDGKENLRFVSTYVALSNQPVVIDDVYGETRFDLRGTKSFDARTSYRTVSMLALPLAPREGEVIGVLQLMNALHPDTGQVVPFSAESIRVASALAAQAAVSLDNHQLVKSQQDLMDSMVRLIAGAIDAKSPYTGSHCERVPELAMRRGNSVPAIPARRGRSGAGGGDSQRRARKAANRFRLRRRLQPWRGVHGGGTRGQVARHRGTDLVASLR